MNKDYVLVTFVNDQTIVDLLEEPFLFKDQKLKIKRAKIQRHRPNKVEYVEGVTKLFIGALPSKLNKKEFRAYFEQFGEIESANLPLKDKINKIHRGHGFINFIDTVSVRSVLEHQNGHYIKDKLVR